MKTNEEGRGKRSVGMLAEKRGEVKVGQREKRCSAILASLPLLHLIAEWVKSRQIEKGERVR